MKFDESGDRMKGKVQVYTWRYCPYCKMAIRLLESKGLPYVEIGIDGDQKAYDKLAKQTGQRTVPFIFVQDTFIGGYDQLKALDDRKELENMLS